VLVEHEIMAGALVRLLGLPEWLIHNLPECEKEEMMAFVGRTAIVTEIDSHGYYWIGFGSTADADDQSSRYSGHSFGVPRNFIEVVREA
jgi:hypothetical protein